MSVIFILMWMVFSHIVADYNLQGWLATAKQKSYWQENAPDGMYKYDYVCALIMHSIGWTFMIMLPIAYAQDFSIGRTFVLIFVCNVVIHALIDHLKANLKLINLWVDQTLHIVQIIATHMILFG